MFVDFRRHSQKKDVVGVTLLGIELVCIFLSPIGAILLTFCGLNPFEILLEHIVLPDPHYRSVGIILGSSIIGLSVGTIGIMEYARNMLLIFFFGSFLMISLQAHLRVLLYKGKLSDQTILQYYLQIFLKFSRGQESISQLILAVLTWAQVILTLFAWIAINCFGVLPVLITFGAGIVFVQGLVLIIFIFGMTASTRLESKELIAKMCQKVFGISGKSLREKYMYRRWWATQPLPINSGGHFHMTKGALIKFLDVLNANVTNAILLIQI